MIHSRAGEDKIGEREKGAGPEKPAPFPFLMALNGSPVPRAPVRSAQNAPRGAFLIPNLVLTNQLGGALSRNPETLYRPRAIWDRRTVNCLVRRGSWSGSTWRPGIPCAWPPVSGRQRPLPCLPSRPRRLRDRPANEGGQGTPLRISYLPRELVITIR